MRFYDRETELEVLRNAYEQSLSSATFTVLMGRRRVGKTSLLLRAMEGKEYAYLFVSKDSEAMLCNKFQTILEQQLQLPIYGTITRFRDLFEVIMRESVKRPITVIFDEFQNLAKINAAMTSGIDTMRNRISI